MSQEFTGTIAFASGKVGDYDIWTLDMVSGEMAQITCGQSWNDKPKFSPDGEWIVFVSDRTGFPEIYKVPVGGGEPIQLTQINGLADSPAFSPDGSSIAFVSNEAGNNDIWLMDANGGDRIQVTRHEGDDAYVEWAADGEGLFWSSDRGNGDADIWHVDLVTQAKTQLNEDAGADFTPVASPDGSLVAFCSTRQLVADPNKPFADRDKDIWLMKSDGQWPVRLTENQGADFAPCWSPDGNHILYTASDHRKVCHLRLLDISAVRAAYAADDRATVEKLARAIRTEAVALERDALKAEIGAHRSATFVTAFLPDSWVASCYPSGYFGLERNPHWAAVSTPAAADDGGVNNRVAEGAI